MVSKLDQPTAAPARACARMAKMDCNAALAAFSWVVLSSRIEEIWNLDPSMPTHVFYPSQIDLTTGSNCTVFA